MTRAARQESSVIPTPTNIDDSGTDSPSTTGAVGDTATLVPAGSASPDAASSAANTNSPAATQSITTPGVIDSGSITAAAAIPDTTAPPASQATEQTLSGGGASDATESTATSVDSSQTDTGSNSDSAQSISDGQSSSSALTETLSTSLSTSTTIALSTLDTFVLPSSSSSIPSSTATSSSSADSSSTVESTPTQTTIDSSSTDSSSSSTNSRAGRTSLTTSFTEVISTINGQVTTIFSPVATLNADTSSTLTSSNRTAIIAGGAAGGVALILLCLLAVFLCRRHQKRKLAHSHRYLPTPRSVMLAGEDDFDLAGPKQPQRGFGIFGSRGRNDSTDEYRDLGSDPFNPPDMRELPSEPPPRLLRPVASKTGSYFQEAVWPPPGEGSQLSDPLMAASNVDLHSIVDDVMGHPSQFGRTSMAASSSSSLPRPARLRGGAAESQSFSSEGETPIDSNPYVPFQHGESPTMSSVESGPSEVPRHLRDWSTDSATGLLANMEGNTRGGRRSSGGSGVGYGTTFTPWLPSGAAPPSAYPRTTSPPLPLRVVTEPPPGHASIPDGLSARAKAGEARQERRSSLAVANPSPEEDRDTASSSIHFPSSFVSESSTQRRRLAGTGTSESGHGYGGTPYRDDSPVDVRSIPPSLTHAWLLDVEDDLPTPTPQPRPREEIPPRYDMIRRDTDTSEDGERPSRLRTL